MTLNYISEAKDLPDAGNQVLTISLEEQGKKREKVSRVKHLDISKGKKFSKRKFRPSSFNGPVIIKRKNEITDLIYEESKADRDIFQSYQQYLQSDHWKIIKSHIRYLRKNKCEGCGSRVLLQVHHGSYAHIGKERDYELFLVCKDCHNLIHKDFILPIRRPNKVLMRRTKFILSLIKKRS